MSKCPIIYPVNAPIGTALGLSVPLWLCSSVSLLRSQAALCKLGQQHLHFRDCGPGQSRHPALTHLAWWSVTLGCLSGWAQLGRTEATGDSDPWEGSPHPIGMAVLGLEEALPETLRDL